MLLIFDGNHCLHRIMHTGSRELHASDGTFTGGCYGVLRTIGFSLRSFNSTKAVAIWDGALSTRRRELYSGYKDRPSSHGDDPTYRQDFETAREQCQQILPRAGVGWLRLPDREADDVIAKAARYYRKTVHRGVVIVTEDRDLFQLVGNGIRVYRPTSDKMIYRGNFEESVARGADSGWGCLPEEWVLFRACEGDRSDCIEGVPGVGPKTVLSLMQEIRENDDPVTLDQLVGAAAAHKSKRIQRIGAALDLLQRNIALMDLSAERFKKREGSLIRAVVDAPRFFDTQQVVPLLRRWEMQSILDEFTAWAASYRRLQ